MEYSETSYNEIIEKLFVRFPSFQDIGKSAYKPGLDNMEIFDDLVGHPHRKYKTIHVAGTNGKGSVSNMLASVLSASGLKTGLYTSPHLLDFRERMRINDGKTIDYISKKEVFDFIAKWKDVFEHLDMSFFEITTMMAFEWFAKREVYIAVIETGLGGRLDSTNIISPVLTIITNIGLDHCEQLGHTLQEIAFEKAGIIKPGIPVLIGESSSETDDVFKRKVLYTNLPEAKFMGDRKKIMELLTFADKPETAHLPDGGSSLTPETMHSSDGNMPNRMDRRKILMEMDLQGSYQEKNLQTVLAAIGLLRKIMPAVSDGLVEEALIHTASRMEFHGRWEKLSDRPLIIADIGHNAHGLAYNFSKLEKMKADGECSSLLIVMGMVADKDLDSVMALMPSEAEYFFTNAKGKRALPAESLAAQYRKFSGRDYPFFRSVDTALYAAIKRAEDLPMPLIYIGGSAYVVAEAIGTLNKILNKNAKS